MGGGHSQHHHMGNSITGTMCYCISIVRMLLSWLSFVITNPFPLMLDARLETMV